MLGSADAAVPITVVADENAALKDAASSPKPPACYRTATAVVGSPPTITEMTMSNPAMTMKVSAAARQQDGWFEFGMESPGASSSRFRADRK